MSTDVLLKPKLDGARFKGGVIPLDVLGDVAALQGLLIEVAKTKFIDANSTRERTRKRTRGFSSNDVRLELQKVEDGSTLLTIALVAATTLFGPEQKRYLQEARDAVVAAIAAAEVGGDITVHLNPSALNHFNRLGRNLQDGEAMRFGAADSTAAAANLTAETRRTLILAAGKQQYTKTYTLRGRVVSGRHHLKRLFEVQADDGRTITVPSDDDSIAVVREAYEGYAVGRRVIVRGVGVFTASDVLKAFESVEEVIPVDPLDVSTRLEALRSLSPGWLDGEGSALGASGVDWLSEAFERHYDDSLPLPHTFPTEEGGVLFEWKVADVDASLDIDLQSRSGAWHELNLRTDEEAEADYDLTTDQGWRDLNERITRLAATADGSTL